MLWYQFYPQQELRNMYDPAFVSSARKEEIKNRMQKTAVLCYKYLFLVTKAFSSAFENSFNMTRDKHA